MSLECDIAEKVIRKKQMQTELAQISLEIKELWYSREDRTPFAVTLAGNVVTVKKASYDGEYNYHGTPTPVAKRPMPITTVAPLVEHCDV